MPFSIVSICVFITWWQLKSTFFCKLRPFLLFRSGFFNYRDMCSFLIGFVLWRLLILEGITLFWFVEDDFVFHRVFAFQICVRHFAGLCLRINFGGLFFFSAVSHLFGRYWTGLKRKWNFFSGSVNTVLVWLPRTARA